MHQNYTMLSGYIPCSGLKGKVRNDKGGDTTVIAIIWRTVTPVARALFMVSTPDCRADLQATTVMTIPPS